MAFTCIALQPLGNGVHKRRNKNLYKDRAFSTICDIGQGKNCFFKHLAKMSFCAVLLRVLQLK